MVPQSERWSFSSMTPATYALATVSVVMFANDSDSVGVDIPVTILPLVSNVADNTIVWIPQNPGEETARFTSFSLLVCQ